MSVGSIGSAPHATLATGRSHRHVQIDRVLHALRQAAMQQTQGSSNGQMAGDRILPSTAAHRPTPSHAASPAHQGNPSISAEPGRPNSGWSTQTLDKSNELAHFGALAANRVTSAQQPAELPRGWRTEEPRAPEALPEISAANGHQTTAPRPAEAVDRMLRNAPVDHSAQSDATRSPAGRRTTHAVQSGTQPQHDQGSVEVTIPPDKARALGLIGANEKPRSVTTTLPKDVARSLGLSVPDESKPGTSPQSATTQRQLS